MLQKERQVFRISDSAVMSNVIQIRVVVSSRMTKISFRFLTASINVRIIGPMSSAQPSILSNITVTIFPLKPCISPPWLGYHLNELFH